MSEIVREGDKTIIRPGKDIVASMAEEFKNELLSTINAHSGKLIIDLAGIEMVDSVGIGVIIATHNTLNRKNRELSVINVSKDIFSLFSTMRLNKRFTVQAAE